MVKVCCNHSRCGFCPKGACHCPNGTRSVGAGPATCGVRHALWANKRGLGGPPPFSARRAGSCIAQAGALWHHIMPAAGFTAADAIFPPMYARRPSQVAPGRAGLLRRRTGEPSSAYRRMAAKSGHALRWRVILPNWTFIPGGNPAHSRPYDKIQDMPGKVGCEVWPRPSNPAPIHKVGAPFGGTAPAGESGARPDALGSGACNLAPPGDPEKLYGLVSYDITRACRRAALGKQPSATVRTCFPP